MIYIVLFIALFSFPFSAFGAACGVSPTTYYVDFSAGNDANSGLATDAAWQHAPGDSGGSWHDSNCVLQAGDIVIFKKGVTYTNTVTSTAPGSEVDNGTNGAITVAGVFSSAGQNFITTVSAGDYLQIYNASTTGAWRNSAGVYAVASVDSDTQLTVTGYTGGAYAAAELTYKVIRFISYASSDLWGTGDATFQVGDTFAIKVDSYTKVSGLKFTQTLLPPDNECTSTAYGCINQTASGTRTSVFIYNNTFDNIWQATYFSDCQYCVISNNNASNWAGILWYGVGSYGLAENNVCITGCSTFRGFQSYAILRFNTVIDAIRESANSCGNHANAFLSQGPSSGTNQYGWIYGNIIDESTTAIQLDYNNDGCDDYVIHSNLIFTGGNRSVAINAHSADRCKIYNNTIIGADNTGYWSYNPIILQGTQDGSEIKNNIIWGTSASIGAIKTTSDVTNATIQNNAYYIPNRATPFIIDSTAKTFAEWQSAGFDTSGSTNGSSPTFNDASGTTLETTNWRLLSTDTVSLNKGVDTSTVANKDVLGVSRPSGIMDIGAYEYQYTGSHRGLSIGGGVSIR
jgi:hypothetical protein